MNTKHKPRLNTQKHGPTGLYELVLVAMHMENLQCTAWMPGTIQLLSSPFLMTSITKQLDAAKR